MYTLFSFQNVYIAYLYVEDTSCSFRVKLQQDHSFIKKMDTALPFQYLTGTSTTICFCLTQDILISMLLVYVFKLPTKFNHSNLRYCHGFMRALVSNLFIMLSLHHLEKRLKLQNVTVTTRFSESSEDNEYWYT